MRPNEKQCDGCEQVYIVTEDIRTCSCGKVYCLGCEDWECENPECMGDYVCEACRKEDYCCDECHVMHLMTLKTDAEQGMMQNNKKGDDIAMRMDAINHELTELNKKEAKDE